jgi:molybdopterin converting factor small subunit
VDEAMPIVWIPALLRELTDGQEKLIVPGATLREVIGNLDDRYPGIEARLCKDDRLQPNLAVVVDGALSRQGLRQALTEMSEVHFIPAISGG